jgi:hypothetical protein
MRSRTAISERSSLWSGFAGALDRYHGLAAGGATAGNDVEPRRLGRAPTPLALTHAGPVPEWAEAAAREVAEKGA